MTLRVALTFDLHDGDGPADVAFAADWLREHRASATFFVPASLLRDKARRSALREAAADGLIELASHSYHHTWDEVDALRGGGPAALGFLRDAHDLHADALGRRPVSFRAPHWTPLSAAALDKLEALGYRVDSSATPGRPALLSSLPFGTSWRSSPRCPYLIRPRLLEVPQSTLLIPLANPTIRTLRRRLSVGLLRVLQREARRSERVLVLMLHVKDVNGRGAAYSRWKPTWRSALLQAHGGFGWKRLLRETDRGRIASTAHAVLDALDPDATFLRLRDVWESRVGGGAAPAVREAPTEPGCRPDRRPARPFRRAARA